MSENFDIYTVMLMQYNSHNDPNTCLGIGLPIRYWRDIELSQFKCSPTLDLILDNLRSNGCKERVVYPALFKFVCLPTAGIGEPLMKVFHFQFNRHDKFTVKERGDIE